MNRPNRPRIVLSVVPFTRRKFHALLLLTPLFAGAAGVALIVFSLRSAAIYCGGGEDSDLVCAVFLIAIGACLIAFAHNSTRKG